MHYNHVNLAADKKKQVLRGTQTTDGQDLRAVKWNKVIFRM